MNRKNQAVIDLLILGKGVIADPAYWAKGAYAKDAQGHTVPAVAPAAACFCSIGAMNRAESRVVPFEVLA